MTGVVEIANFPKSRVKAVAVSALYDKLPEIRELGIQTVEIPPNSRISAPVASHADMNICHLKGRRILLAQGLNDIAVQLKNLGFEPEFIDEPLECGYPNEVKLNCKLIGNYAVGAPAALCRRITAFCSENEIKLINVKQGYAACSVLSVTQNAVITADLPIGRALDSAGFDVLLIRPGHIRLDGYDYGFIGGCGGLIDKSMLLFSGNIKSHPDYEAIHNFLLSHGVSEMCLGGELTDIGGILPLTELK